MYTNRRAIAFGNFLSKTREIHFSERLKALFVYRFKVIKDKRISDSVINKSSNPPVINGHLICYAYYIQFDAFLFHEKSFSFKLKTTKEFNTRARPRTFHLPRGVSSKVHTRCKLGLRFGCAARV